MKKKLLLSVACLLILSGCGNPSLKNKENAVTIFSEGEISADALYNSLKDKYGIETLIDLIDADLLERLYDKNSSETNYITEQIKAVKATVSENEYELNSYIQYYYKVNNIDELKEYFRLNYRRQLWMQDHAKTIISDKELETYYKNRTIGDIDLSWILVAVKSSETDNDDIKEKSVAEALATAKEIIKKLDNKENFASLAQTYSADTTTSKNGGSLGKVNRKSVSDVIIEEAISLSKNTYSASPVKTTEGYAILLVNNKDKKPDYNDETKEEIATAISNEKIQQDNGSFYLESLEALRSKYSMTFKDSNLSDDYTIYMNKLKNSIK